ncbi:ribosomal protein S18-alanine N-acetyltransferase [Plantactinospora siamensis]|uniref:[Ribosomal protein bS18]-alanine N-acetyltransferase n=1 Tax=Plantactinospora siamensis TaxID=555372 RepID=A0ABV6NPQ2_9ACTN
MTTAPSDAVRILPMRWWHIEDILPIEDDAFGADRWSPAMFWNELANRHHYLIAVEPPTGRLVGYAGLALQPPSEAWVQSIAVRRDSRRSGVGRALLTELLRVAQDAGARSVLLEVAVDNAPAQRLYAAYGFEPLGIRRGYYQSSNTDALVMERHG